MRSFFALSIILFTSVFSFAQNEQSPIVEKDIAYKDWTYKNVHTGENMNLREYAKDKKLVMVVYFAPWCPNWKYDAPMLQRLYEKYQSKGLGIVAVGEYDPVSAMKANLDQLKITFPAVYESENRSAKQKTLHYQYRTVTGDTRGWGSPWYIFLKSAAIEKSGDTLVNKTFVINGEMVESEGEKFIRKNIGLPMMQVKMPGMPNAGIEVCDPQSATTALLRP